VPVRLQQGDGGFLFNVGVRLILGGIAALSAGFAVGLALTSGGQEDDSATAELRTEPSRLSVFGSIHPKRFDVAWDALGLQVSDGSRLRIASLGPDLAFAGREPARTPRLSFDERFLQGEGFEIDRRSVFEERFAFDQSAVFEERFAFDQRPEPFE